METFLSNIVQLCHENLLQEDQDDPLSGFAYLRGRGVTIEQIQEFKIGYGLPNIWTPKELRDTPDGKKFNQQFRGSLEGQVTFPIWNSVGKLKGLETRLIEETETRKYTQYWLTSWKEDAVFLGLPSVIPHIWDTGVVFLVEGMFDFFPAQRILPNTLCTLSAKVMASQYRFLQRYCKHVVFMFDCDEKGIQFSTEAMDKYNIDTRDGFMAHRIVFPTKDISQLYETWGFNRFQEYLKTQVDKMNLYL